MALTPPFATTNDLELRWRPLTLEQEPRAEALLLDASQKILDEDRRGALDRLTEPTPTLVRIVCAMVQRAMASSAPGGPPVTQESRSWAGGFSQSQTFANPTGDIYLTKAERRDLGLSRQRAGGIDMWAGAYADPTA